MEKQYSLKRVKTELPKINKKFGGKLWKIWKKNGNLPYFLTKKGEKCDELLLKWKTISHYNEIVRNF